MAAKIPTREFIFLRHGETEYNRLGRLQGRVDVPLNSTGHAQAELASSILATRQITRIVSSPAQRVLQTVQPLLAVDETPMHIDDDLMEFSVGGFEGRLITEIFREHALGEDESWMSVLPDDAERWHEFVPRVCAAVSRWTDQYADETILVASHGLVFLALVEALTGARTYSQNAEPHHFQPVEDGWNVSPLLA